MRFSQRILLRVIGVCACVILLHVCYSFIVQGGSVLSSPSVLTVQHGADSTVHTHRSNNNFTKTQANHREEISLFVKNKYTDRIQELSRIDAEKDTLGTIRALAPTELSDIYFSVKTTAKFHASRVETLLKTWAGDAKEQTYFFTDVDDPVLSEKTGGRVINTNCSSVHTRIALCCKMSVELDYFMASSKRWFCHVDDDTYVNLKNLLKLLQGFNHTHDWYIGRPSLSHPLKLKNKGRTGLESFEFWFATGGAGFCLSRGLALKMVPYAGGGKLKTVCDKIRLPDDVTVGYVIYRFLHKNLTFIQGFHSHLEGLYSYRDNQIPKLITLSYSAALGRLNRVNVHGFNTTYDPTRFLSVHCLLYPQHTICRR